MGIYIYHPIMEYDGWQHFMEVSRRNFYFADIYRENLVKAAFFSLHCARPHNAIMFKSKYIIDNSFKKRFNY